MDNVLADLDDGFDEGGLPNAYNTHDMITLAKHAVGMDRSGKEVIPASPATSTFKRPMLFPVAVKGRRLGILILGMIN